MSMAIRSPEIVPVGWEVTDTPIGSMIHQRLYSGLQITLAIETYDDPEDAPGEIPGEYVRVVMSRPHRYPTWDEMKRFIEDCGFFDRTRDVIMLLPPQEGYVNVHQNAFHWFQRRAVPA